jgi:hypothetical protein
MAYTSDELDAFLDKFETCCTRQVAVQDKVVKLRAAERDTLTVAEDIRDLCNRALKGSKTKLQEVFGSNDCMRIGRPRIAKKDIVMSDMHKSDVRWTQLDEILDAIEEVLKTLGAYKPWVPGKVPVPSNIRYEANRGRFNPGERVNLQPMVEGDVESWSVDPHLPDGLHLNHNTGFISGLLGANFEMPERTFVVTAKNGSGESSMDLTFSVSVAAPGKMSYDFADAHVGEPIVWTLTVEDGGPPSSFSVAPKLPKGLSIDSRTGQISGLLLEPSGDEAVVCTVTGTNSGGSNDCEITFSVLQSEPETLEYRDVSQSYPPKGVVYAAPVLCLKQHGDPALFSALNLSTQGPILSSHIGMNYTVSPALPEGLTIAAATGVISGSSDEAVPATTYTITAENSAGRTAAEVTFEIKILPPSNLAFPEVAEDYNVHQPVVLTPEVMGAVDEWSLEGDLPDGLAFDASSGSISGVPTSVCGRRTFKIVAKNSTGTTDASITFSIVRPAPSNLDYPAAQSTYQVRQAVAIQPTFDGEVSEFTVSPALPDGLKIDPATGEISGQPTAIASEAVFEVTAKNETGLTTATIKFACNLDPPGDLSYPDVDDEYHVCEEVSVEPEMRGGATNWIVEPALPDGLSLDPVTGVISGEPTRAAEEAEYVITASNEAGGTSVVLCFCVLETPPSGLGYPTVGELIYVDAKVNWEPILEAGEASSWEVFPALPDGLTLDVKTGAIEGAPKNTAEKTSFAITSKNMAGETTVQISFAVREAETGEDDADQAFACSLDACTEIQQMPTEPNKERNEKDWMLWMVHRAWLNDETLTDFNFSGRAMLPPHIEPRMAPKLMQALATNTHIVSCNLNNSKLMAAQAPAMAEALKQNGTLKNLEIEGNYLVSDNIKIMAEALTDNSVTALETWRFASQIKQGTSYGRPTEEALGKMVSSNTRITKLGVYCQDAHWRNVISKAVMKNTDAARRRRKQRQSIALTAPASLVKAVNKPLQNLVLTTPPTVAAWDVFPDDDEFMTVARSFTADKKACPTAQQFQGAVKAAGKSIGFSKVAPVLNDFRTKLLDSFKTLRVTVKDSSLMSYDGAMVEWSNKNQNWSIDVWPSDTSHFTFEKKGELAIEISDEVKDWLKPKAD